MTTTRGHTTLKDELRMTTLTRAFGAVLIVVGVVAYVLTGASSPTALIRAVLGLAILALSFLASRRPALHRLAIHGAIALAMILVLGSAGVATSFMVGLLSGEPVIRPAAGAAYSITVLLCAAYITAGIRYFVAGHKHAGGDAHRCIAGRR